MKVCLDPGHGGYDPGAVGNGLQEKDITLDVCLELKPMLENNGITVVMTRDGDYAPGHLEGNLNGELQVRVNIAEQNNVDIFVAVHINAGGGTGEEVLVSGNGGRAEQIAKSLLAELVSVSGWYNRGVNVQDVMVLRDTSMPAILTENGFIDSVSDTAKLKDPAFIHALAVAHAKGICGYFGIVYTESGPATPVVALNFTHPNNAKCINDDLYIRDANGNRIPGRYVATGDNITVLDVGYTSQLALVEYPTAEGVKGGYVANVASCIQYYHQGEWQNGSTPEKVLDENGGVIGSLNPGEKATPLYRSNGKLHVVYSTTKGANTKSGYVAWDGSFKQF